MKYSLILTLLVYCLGNVLSDVVPTESLTKAEQVARAEERELARLRADAAADAAAAREPQRVAERPTPLVAEPKTLIALHDTEPIWLSADKKTVVVVGRVVLREGMLELFACRRRSKEHESILALDVTPHLLHAALLAIGADAGKPASFEPKFTPAHGDTISIRLHWKGDEGRQKTATPQDWLTQRRIIVDKSIDNPPNAKPAKPATEPALTPITWVFAGSLTYPDADGRLHYVADETGELIGLSNFAGAILDLPLESTSSNESLLFSPKTDAIPPLGTEVTLVLSHEKASRKTEPPLTKVRRGR